MQDDIKLKIKNILEKLQLPGADFAVDAIVDEKMGDYATNVAMVLAKQVGKNPKALAEEIKTELENLNDKLIEKIEVAGPGFINFFLKPEVFVKNIEDILRVGDSYGKNEIFKGRKIMIEYTDPNVMKPFHIGHLMTNSIGESLSRLFEFSGAEVKRANYYSDSGLAIAKAVWGMIDMVAEMPGENDSITKRTDFLGRAYVHGVKRAEEDPSVAEAVKEINKKIYDRSDNKIVELYDMGKKWSLEHFDILYKKLGSTFDYLIAETTVAPVGLEIVKNNLGKVFEESEGAVVFKGEKYDKKLHTRVFINREGIPTYEAKEVALNKTKYDLFKFNQSFVFTGNEQNDYFRVVLRAIKELWPEIAEKTKHFGHGMLRLPDGKMSSRKGNAITGEALISDVEKLVWDKMVTSPVPEEDRPLVVSEVAVGAVKFSILKQAIGGDIIYDFDKSISFEGDSGPYLQYTHARIKSVLSKAGEMRPKVLSGHEVGSLEKKLAYFPEIVSRSANEFSPQYIVTYLLELASSFNTYYSQNKIIDIENRAESEHRLALALATAQVLKNGLWLLGIKVPERM